MRKNPNHSVAEQALARLERWHADELKALRFDHRARPSSSSTRTATIRGAKTSTKSTVVLRSQPYPDAGKRRAELGELERTGDTAGLVKFTAELDEEYGRLSKHKLPPLNPTQENYWKNPVFDDENMMISSVPKAPNQADRVRRAKEFRAEGMSYQQIADVFGVKRQSVHTWVKGGLKGERERKLPV